MRMDGEITSERYKIQYDKLEAEQANLKAEAEKTQQELDVIQAKSKKVGSFFELQMLYYKVVSEAEQLTPEITLPLVERITVWDAEFFPPLKKGQKRIKKQKIIIDLIHGGDITPFLQD